MYVLKWKLIPKLRFSHVSGLEVVQFLNLNVRSATLTDGKRSFPPDYSKGLMNHGQDWHSALCELRFFNVSVGNTQAFQGSDNVKLTLLLR